MLIVVVAILERKKFKFKVHPLSFSVKGTGTCTACLVNLSRPNVKLKINALMERRGLNDNASGGEGEDGMNCRLFY